MINKKFQSFMLATIALALCVLAGDKIYDALIPANAPRIDKVVFPKQLTIETSENL
jgi:hypothetical protein